MSAGSPRRDFAYWNLLWEMTVTEMKLRDQGTFFGFLWTLLHPALMFAVLYALFIKWMGAHTENYAAYLLIGLVLWTFFQRSTTVALGSFKRNMTLIMNFKFPREIVVLSSVGAVFWTTLLETAVLLPSIVIMGARPAWSWLLLPVIALLLLALCAAVSLFLAFLAVEFQDMDRIWDVAAMAMFYTTPVFYPLSILSESRQALVLLSPVTRILMAARTCLIQGAVPELGPLAGVAALGGFGVAAGLWALRRSEYRVADHLMI